MTNNCPCLTYIPSTYESMYIFTTFIQHVLPVSPPFVLFDLVRSFLPPPPPPPPNTHTHTQPVWSSPYKELTILTYLKWLMVLMSASVEYLVPHKIGFDAVKVYMRT